MLGDQSQTVPSACCSWFIVYVVRGEYYFVWFVFEDERGNNVWW
jgi:hypothetical protein